MGASLLGHRDIPAWVSLCGHEDTLTWTSSQGHWALCWDIQPGHWAIPASTHAGSLPWLLPVCRTSQPEHPCCGLCCGTKASLLGYPFWGTRYNTYMRAPSMAQCWLFHRHQIPQLGHHGTGSLCVCRAPLWASSGTAGHLTAWVALPGTAVPTAPPVLGQIRSHSHIQKSLLGCQGSFCLEDGLGLVQVPSSS